jgi:sarcosine oxidase, subunit beta
MNKIDVDVAIIGGGTAGCSAALHLRKRGLSVALVERRQCGSQASGVNFGGVRQHGRDTREIPLTMLSRSVWDALPELVGDDCEFRPTGHLKLARSESDMAVLEEWSRTARGFGIETTLMTRAMVRKAYPFLGDEVVGASFCPSDGAANPRLVAPAFARAARRAGAHVFEEIAVVHAVRQHDGFFIETDRDLSVKAAKLVNTAGAWGSHIAGMFKEAPPEFTTTPNLIVTEPFPYFIEVNIGVVEGGIYFRQISRGNIILGGGRGTGDAEAIWSRPLAEVSLESFREARRLVPRLAKARVIRSWSGLEGNMPDGVPVVGPSATTPDLIHGFGFSGHGFQLGPGMGRILADLVVDGDPGVPLDGLAVDRFAIE